MNPTTLNILRYHYPYGELTIEQQYEICDSLIQPSDMQPQLEYNSVAEIKKNDALQTQGLFSKKRPGDNRRSIWEEKNPTVLGYFLDKAGIEHQLRRVNKTQYAY